MRATPEPSAPRSIEGAKLTQLIRHPGPDPSHRRGGGNLPSSSVWVKSNPEKAESRVFL
jgi:hypothetical protein